MTSGKRQGFVPIPRQIFEDTRLNGIQLAALSRLASHSPRWVVKRPVESKALGITDDTYGKILNHLESCGYITRKKAYKRGKVDGLYIKVTWPDVVDLNPKIGELENGFGLDCMDVIDDEDWEATGELSRSNSTKLTPKIGGLENSTKPPQTGARNKGLLKEHNRKDHKGALEASNVALIRPVANCLEYPAPPCDDALYVQSLQEAAQWEPCSPNLSEDPNACPEDEWLGHLPDAGAAQ